MRRGATLWDDHNVNVPNGAELEPASRVAQGNGLAAASRGGVMVAWARSGLSDNHSAVRWTASPVKMFAGESFGIDDGRYCIAHRRMSISLHRTFQDQALTGLRTGSPVAVRKARRGGARERLPRAWRPRALAHHEFSCGTARRRSLCLPPDRAAWTLAANGEPSSQNPKRGPPS
jgi:hypothetical protein